MSNKINTFEQNLKKRFEQHQSDFDQQAFNKFKAQLDKKKKRRWLFFWSKSSLNTLALVLMSCVVLSLSYLGIQNLNSSFASTESTSNHRLEKVVENRAQADKDAQISDPNSKALTPTSDSTPEEIFISDQENKDDNSNALENTNYITKPASEKTTNNLQNPANYSKNKVLPRDKPILNSRKILSTTNSKNSTLNTSDRANTYFGEGAKKPDLTLAATEQRNAIQGLQDISSLPIASFSIDEGFLSQPKLAEYSPPPFDTYFYANLNLGLSGSDYVEHIDDFLSIKNDSPSTLFRLTGAYQLTRNTAFGVSLARTKWTNEWTFKNVNTYHINSGKMYVASLHMISRILSYKSKFDLKLISGGSILLNNIKNENLEVVDSGLPFAVQFFESNWTSVQSGRHYYFDSGIILDYMLSERVSANVMLNYSHGFKPLSRQNVRYIHGEGIVDFFETQTTGAFGSIELGVQYRFLRE